MKRTFTAACAVLASGAGVVGMAGAAHAAPAPEQPAVPLDGRTSDVLHKVPKAVGEVVALAEEVGTTGSLKPVTDAVSHATTGHTLGTYEVDLSKPLPVGRVVPMDQAPAVLTPVTGVVGGAAEQVTGTAQQLTGAAQGRAEQGVLPPLGVPIVDQLLHNAINQSENGRSGGASALDPVTDLLTHGPLGGDMQLGR
ncbi:hypothetical protein [Saccharopolyspora sp. CA-218241]|uniref:hypothetical protein n=1 Tax=Saccharopolyspora sp. CA-218241 TaxID=3240027 RepID=UPI003D9699E7